MTLLISGHRGGRVRQGRQPGSIDRGGSRPGRRPGWAAWRWPGQGGGQAGAAAGGGGGQARRHWARRQTVVHEAAAACGRGGGGEWEKRQR
jgi:hypothetical protein